MKLTYYSSCIALIFAAMLSSCSAPKKVTYFENADVIPQEVLSQVAAAADPILRPGDLLNIYITATNMTAVVPFNRGSYITPEGTVAQLRNATQNTSQTGVESSTDYYLIDKDGYIDFPLLGKIHAAGRTKDDLVTTLRESICPKYITEVPNVDIRLMNFRVTVAGAVKSPGVYQSRNERMTFLEAIAMAGDLDIKGDRENILLYRTNADGSREVHRLNIHDKNFLLSPYMNLQQNDYIYVEPNSSLKQNAWQLNSAVGATITIVGGMSSLAGLIIGIINLTDDK